MCAPVFTSAELGETRWRCGPIDGVTQGSISRLVDPEHRAELHLVHGRLQRGPGYSAAPRSARQVLARVGAMLKLRALGRYHVHAAGVLAPDGRAWLLTGASGCGKSTLTYALARRGWPVLGDDGVVLEQTSAGVVAHAWRKPLHVSIELAAWFPELRQYHPFVDWHDNRHRVSVEASYARHATLAGVIVLERGTTDRLSPLAPTAALVALIRQSTFLLVTDTYSSGNLAMLRTMVETVPCFSLQHSSEQLQRISATIVEAVA